MSETRRDRWGRYPGGGIVNRGGTCEHTDSLDDAMARLEQSLALSPSSKAGPVPSVGPVDEDDSPFARAFRAEMARPS